MMTPARNRYAIRDIAPTSSAVQVASAQNLAGSPPARSPSDAPTSNEIADVTVMDVCRELQNSQNTSPENRQAYNPASAGRLASEASPMPAGSR